MEAVRSADEIRDVNTRYHDAAAAGYDSKWGIDFGEVGRGQVLGKLRKVLGAELSRGFERSLEIGAGTGYFSLNLLQAGVVQEATCTDISPGMLRTLSDNAARLGLTVKAARADAEALPFADRSFDLVLGHAVLHHLPDLQLAFEEFHRVLQPGGRIVFAGEPSRTGDVLASIPKRGANLVAPVWRAVLRLDRPPPAEDGLPGQASAGQASAGQASAGQASRGGASRGGAPGGQASGGGASGARDHGLERMVDIHAFTPGDLIALASQAGFSQVRVRGEELLSNWFGWFNRTLEARADASQVPMLWRQYAFHGYLALQRLDNHVLEPRLPPAIFYNLLLAARKP